LSWKWSSRTRRSHGCLTGATMLDTIDISSAVVGKVAQRLLDLLVRSLPLWLIRHPGLGRRPRASLARTLPTDHGYRGALRTAHASPRPTPCEQRSCPASGLSWLSLVRTLGEGVADRLGLGRDAWLGCEALVADHDGSPRPTRPTAATKPSPRPAAQARLARSGPCQTPAPTGAAPARHADAHGPPRPEPQDQPRYAPIRCARSPTPADPAYA